MSVVRSVFRSLRVQPSMATRTFSSTTRHLAENTHPNTADYRETMKKTPLNPHMTNTNSTQANEMPSSGANKVPPEFISLADGDFVPKDSSPENTERMTGGTQPGAPKSGPNAQMSVADKGKGGEVTSGEKAPGELSVGEMEDIEFKVEPLRRTGEDVNTIRARLLYQSRKRGTLESDLLMSTFADTNLEKMSLSQMQQYDLFLDENDWDIYYWATQEPTPTSQETAEGAMEHPQGATATASGSSEGYKGPANGNAAVDVGKSGPVEKGAGEWAQTVGTFKPLYRPVPQRWRNSEVLSMLRKHVIDRSAGGDVLDGIKGQSTKQTGSGTGMAFMPEVRNMDA